MLYLTNPDGDLAASRARPMLDTLRELNQHPARTRARSRDRVADRPVRDGLPDADERAGGDGLLEGAGHVSTSTAPTCQKPGTFAANCLLARRLAERGVRFIQLYHQGWDQHGDLPSGIRAQCRETDQPAAALITDLKQRGLLDDTLVIWGGEFGRTNYSPGQADADRLRPRSPSALLHRSGWPAAGSSRA